MVEHHTHVTVHAVSLYVVLRLHRPVLLRAA
jgi:hypothetical protein